MKIRNESEMGFDPSGSYAPWDWYGDIAPSGASPPWRNAPLMSRYTSILSGSEALYVKVANTGADADWSIMQAAANYVGPSGTNGNWRLTVSGTQLLVQRLESATWTTKATFDA